LARVEILRKLKREVVRFRTFQNWSSTAIQPNLLAKAGFFYFNDRDKVQCAFCLGIIGQWEPTDDPFVEHRRHFPRCPFVLGLPVGNVPIDTVTGRERSIQPQINGGFDVTGIRPEVRVNAEPDRGGLEEILHFCSLVFCRVICRVNLGVFFLLFKFVGKVPKFVVHLFVPRLNLYPKNQMQGSGNKKNLESKNMS